MKLKENSIFRVAFRLSSIAALKINTNRVSRSFSWIPGLAGQVQLAAEWKEDEVGTRVPDAIRIVVDVEAHNVDEAVTLAETAVDAIARLFAFSAGAPYVPARLLAAFDVTPGRIQRTYKQWAYDLVMVKPKRPIDVSAIELNAESLGNRDAKDRSAVLRGMKWYTDALNERVLADRFLKAWVGLESIGAAISARVHKGRRAPCPECLGVDASRGPEARELRGMRHLLSVVEPNEPDLFASLKRGRNKLVHGVWTLEKIEEELRPHIDSVLNALLRGVLTLMAPPGTAGSKREAFQPGIIAQRGADASVSLEVMSSDPNVLGELVEKLEIRALIRGSRDTDEGYRVDAALEMTGSFGVPVKNIEFRSEREDELVYELAAQPEVASITALTPRGERWNVPIGSETTPENWEKLTVEGTTEQ